MNASPSLPTSLVHLVRRMRSLALVLGSILLLTGCSGATTGAVDVTHASAKLTAKGTCSGGGKACYYYFKYRRSNNDSTRRTTKVVGPITARVVNASLSETITGLSANTVYEYQVCGWGDAYSQSQQGCAGPSGDGSTWHRFTTRTAPVTPPTSAEDRVEFAIAGPTGSFKATVSSVYDFAAASSFNVPTATKRLTYELGIEDHTTGSTTTRTCSFLDLTPNAQCMLSPVPHGHAFTVRVTVCASAASGAMTCASAATKRRIASPPPGGTSRPMISRTYSVGTQLQSGTNRVATWLSTDRPISGGGEFQLQADAYVGDTYVDARIELVGVTASGTERVLASRACTSTVYGYVNRRCIDVASVQQYAYVYGRGAHAGLVSRTAAIAVA